MILIDLSLTKLTGKDFEETLGKVGITVNKNTIPQETRSPFVTSGIRIGTPAITTRGMQEDEMQEIASIFKECLIHHKQENKLSEIKLKVLSLTKRFPIYQNWK